MGEATATRPALPADTYFGDTMKMSHYFNGEGVQLIHVPNGTPDGDSIVWFRGSDVIATGDLFELSNYPRIGVQAGGTIAGLQRSPNLAFAEFRTEGGRVTGAQDEVYLVITKILEDSQYLNTPYVRSMQFRKQNDASGWNPTACQSS